MGLDEAMATVLDGKLPGYRAEVALDISTNASEGCGLFEGMALRAGVYALKLSASADVGISGSAPTGAYRSITVSLPYKEIAIGSASIALEKGYTAGDVVEASSIIYHAGSTLSVSAKSYYAAGNVTIGVDLRRLA